MDSYYTFKLIDKIMDKKKPLNFLRVKRITDDFTRSKLRADLRTDLIVKRFLYKIC